MTDSINVSVIIPVYNNQTFIYDCLQSVINQSLKNIEIICVNDGSTDLTLSILNDFSKKDSRIIVLNQNNNGPGFSRNRAARIAKGKYLYFMDSDDTIDVDCLERLFLVSEKYNSDICLVGVNAYDEISKSYVSYLNFSTKKYKKDTLIKKNSLHKELFYKFAPFFLFYRKDFFINNNLSFNENYLLGEDVLCSINAKVKANKFAVCNSDLYHYRINTASSITSNINNKKIDDLFSYLTDMYCFLTKNKLWADYKKYYFDYISKTLKAYYMDYTDKTYFLSKLVLYNKSLRNIVNDQYIPTDIIELKQIFESSKLSYFVLYTKRMMFNKFFCIERTLCWSYISLYVLNLSFFKYYNSDKFLAVYVFGRRIFKISKK